MDNILPAYNDPLFSILVIVTLILIIAISSYVMGNIKEERKEKSLKHFLNRFSSKESSFEIEEMPFEPKLINTLKRLAFAFKNQGEYQKAINLNIYLIDNISNFTDKKEILEQLGETYLKAGFLKRAETIFLQILHKYPRNIEALYYLGVVYEMLHEYDRALETLIPLTLLGEDTNSLEGHLKLNILLNNREINCVDKVKRLEALLDNSFYDKRRIIKALFQLDSDSAWRNIKACKVESIVDILWFLPLSNLNFDIILSDKILSAIFFAKGVFPLQKDNIPKSNIFVIDTIISAKIGGSDDIDITFSYGCNRCRQHFPIPFTRCPQCYSIDDIHIKETVAKKYRKKGYSLL